MRTIALTLILGALAFHPAPAAAQEPAGGAADVEVTQAVVATGVQDREPVGADSTFAADVGTLYFYTVFEGDFGTRSFAHVWLHDGEEVARIPLQATGPRWRTWSTKTIPADWTGSWTARVEDADGTVLKSVDFTVGGD